LDAELVRLGYQPSTLRWYRGYWRRLERWFAAQNVREFSLDVAMAWVDEVCGGFFEKEQAGTLKQTDVYVFRVAAMLDDFAVHGSVLRRYSRSVSKLNAEQADVLAGFGAWLGAAGCAVSTVRAYGTVAGELLAFTASRGGLAALDGAVIGAFVQTLAGYQPKTVEHKLCAVRSLLRFAATDGLVDEAVLTTVPAVKSVRQARVPSVWEAGEVAKILEAIDRANPSGKRDYAIVLLICRLGLRAVDANGFSSLIWTGRATGSRWCRRRPAAGSCCRCSRTSAGRSSTTFATAAHGAIARRCLCGIPRRSARSPIRTICTRSWSSTPASRTCRWARSVAGGCIRSGTRSRPA